MIKKIVKLIKEELAQRKKELLFKRISALHFDGQYFQWLASQLPQDVKVTVRSTDGKVVTEYGMTLMKGNAVYDIDLPGRNPIPKPGVRIS